MSKGGSKSDPTPASRYDKTLRREGNAIVRVPYNAPMWSFADPPMRVSGVVEPVQLSTLGKRNLQKSSRPLVERAVIGQVRSHLKTPSWHSTEFLKISWLLEDVETTAGPASKQHPADNPTTSSDLEGCVPREETENGCRPESVSNRSPTWETQLRVECCLFAVHKGFLVSVGRKASSYTRSLVARWGHFSCLSSRAWAQIRAILHATAWQGAFCLWGCCIEELAEFVVFHVIQAEEREIRRET